MIKNLRRKRIASEKLSERRKVICHIDIESVHSKGTLIASKQNEEAKLLADITLSTRNYFESQDNFKSIADRSLPKSGLEKIVSDILTNLLRKANIDPERIDSLSACSDFFTPIETPAEIAEETRKILDLGQKKLEGKLTKIEFPPPKISANETKSKLIAGGAQRLIESKLEPNYPTKAFLDISTFLSGISLGGKDLDRTMGLFLGLGSEILDAIARGHEDVKNSDGTVYSAPTRKGKIYENEAEELSSQAAEIIDIQRIPSGKEREGMVPINMKESYKQQVKLVGCDVGENGSDLEEITEIGQKASSYGSATLKKVIDKTFARLVGGLIKTMYEEELINESSSVCISGREYFGKKELRLAQNHLSKIGFEKIGNNLILLKNPAGFGVLKNKFL